MIYNIPIGQPFLDNFIKGYFYHYQSSLSDYSQTRIFLPNKRACRELTKLFLNQEINPTLTLPKINVIGELDTEDEITISSFKKNLTLITPISLRLIIVKLLQNKIFYYKYRDKEAFSLAASLEAFYLELIKEEVNLVHAKHIFTRELQNSQIIDNLSIIVEDLPQYMKNYNLIDPISYRYYKLDLIANAWKNSSPQFPIIIAAPNEFSASMLNFIKIVENQKKGNIILQNFLFNNETKCNIDVNYTFLLENLNINPRDIQMWNDSYNVINNPNIEFAIKLFQDYDNIIDSEENHKKLSQPSLAFITCKNEFETALNISNLMKKCFDQNLYTVLLTNDQQLRQKVKIHLIKWNIHLNDSSGIEINKTFIGSFLQLCLQLILDNFSTISILSLLKHPYSGLGYKRSELRKRIRNIELLKRKNNIFNNIISENELAIKEQLANLSTKFAFLLRKRSTLQELVNEHIKFAGKIATILTEDHEEESILWNGEEGNQIKEFFDQLIQSTKNYEMIDGKSYSDIYHNLLSHQMIRKIFNITDRLQILTAEEAYLLSFDHVIIADLEDNLLSDKLNSPWANLRLRDKLHLNSINELIISSNQTMRNLFTKSFVSIFHSTQKQGILFPQAKLYIKIQSILQKFYFNSIEFNACYNFPQEESKYAQQIFITSPKPRAVFEPKTGKITITQVQKLMQDPYAFYAEEVLKLKKLNSLYNSTLFLEFGIFIHKIIHNAISLFSNSWQNHFIDIATSDVMLLSLPSHIQEIWLLKVKRIAEFLDLNLNLKGKIFSETKGKWLLKNGFTLEAKADLIIEDDNSIKILDFKTGSLPSVKFIELGLYPQLPLEALIINKSGFQNISHPQLEKELIYIKLSGTNPAGEIFRLNDSNSMIAQAENGFLNFIDFFISKEQIYLSAPYYRYNIFSKDYTHLARIKEWN